MIVTGGMLISLLYSLLLTQCAAGAQPAPARHSRILPCLGRGQAESHDRRGALLLQLLALLFVLSVKKAYLFWYKRRCLFFLKKRITVCKNLCFAFVLHQLPAMPVGAHFAMTRAVGSGRRVSAGGSSRHVGGAAALRPIRFSVGFCGGGAPLPTAVCWVPFVPSSGLAPFATCVCGGRGEGMQHGPSENATQKKAKTQKCKYSQNGGEKNMFASPPTWPELGGTSLVFVEPATKCPPSTYSQLGHPPMVR